MNIRNEISKSLKIRTIMAAAKKIDEAERIMANPVIVKRLDESKKQIEQVRGVGISLESIFRY